MLRNLTVSALLLLAGAQLGAAQDLTDAELPYKDEGGTKVPLFMHEGTFADQSSSSWTRDSVEVEAAMTIQGLTGQELHRRMTERDFRLFKRLRRDPLLEAFSIGFPSDEIPWNTESHIVREGGIPGQPGKFLDGTYVWLRIEPEKFEVDEERGRRRLDLGTDVMDDIYYDTKDFLLLRSNMSTRARKRWDTETEMRRLLIALKVEAGVDSFGIKRAAKTDVREDSPSAAAITGLDEAVLRGMDSWNNKMANPLKRMWTRLKNRGELKSSPTYKNVLILQPRAFLRSIRSRYHLNEVSVSSLRETLKQGQDRLQALIDMARAARMDNAIPANRLSAVQAWEAKAKGLLDNTLIAVRAEKALNDLGVADIDSEIATLLPGSTSLGKSTSLADLSAREITLQRRRAVAEELCTIYHELADELDEGTPTLRDVITRAPEDMDAYADWFRDWRREVDPSLRRYRTPGKYAEAFDGIADVNSERTAFNRFGEEMKDDDEDDWEDFSRLSASKWRSLRFVLRAENVRIWQRQIQTAGSTLKGLWFDEACRFYVPESRRQTGNFLIDTIDFASMYHPRVWGDTPAAERTAAVDLNTAEASKHLVASAFVNEVQIELTVGGAYTERLKYLRGLIELPREFMRWASAEGHADDPAAYAALFETYKALGEDELQAKIAPLNDRLAKTLGQVTAAEFKSWIDPVRLTLEVRDDADYAEPEITRALTGAQFVFKQYRDMLGFVSKLKGERFIDRIDRNGETLLWVPSKSSKGVQALEAIKAREVKPGGISGSLNGN